jgi:hypothetical protein
LDSSLEGPYLSYCCLAVIAGRPAISYLDTGSGDLQFVAALDTEGSSWATPLPLDSQGSTGLTSSMIDLGAQAAIAYYDYPDGSGADGQQGALRFITGF